MKKFRTIFAALLMTISMLGVITTLPVYAEPEQKTVNLYLFHGDGCPHCADAKEFLEPYVKENPYIKFYQYEVWYNQDNLSKLKGVANELGFEASGVPLLIVGDKEWAGWSETIKESVVNRLEQCSELGCPDSVADNVGAPLATSTSKEDKTVGAAQDEPKAIDLPLLGKIDPSSFSLPVLTIIFGLIDGFNPCAMWALIFIISLLIGMNDRKRMIAYGAAFIATSAVVYFLVMAAWLNLFMFVGNIALVRIAIGILALGIGAYYLYDWYRNRPGCKVTEKEKRKATFVKLREIVKGDKFWLGLGGIIVLALVINTVEFACSAGLPALYTGILSGAELPAWQYYLYLLLYVLFFMLDDLIVFFIAIMTMKVVGIEGKYSRWMRLIGGILMLIVGLLLIFAPGVLMFG